VGSLLSRHSGHRFPANSTPHLFKVSNQTRGVSPLIGWLPARQPGAGEGQILLQVKKMVRSARELAFELAPILNRPAHPGRQAPAKAGALPKPTLGTGRRHRSALGGRGQPGPASRWARPGLRRNSSKPWTRNRWRVVGSRSDGPPLPQHLAVTKGLQGPGLNSTAPVERAEALAADFRKLPVAMPGRSAILRRMPGASCSLVFTSTASKERADHRSAPGCSRSPARPR